MPKRPRYYEYDARIGMMIDRDLAEWLEYVLSHYVIKDKTPFYYQIDRITAVRLRRQLIDFMEARDGTSYATDHESGPPQTGLGADDPDGYRLRSEYKSDD